MHEPENGRWVFPATIAAIGLLSMWWDWTALLNWWLVLLAFFFVSGVLAMTGIFLPDPVVWLAKRIRKKDCKVDER